MRIFVSLFIFALFPLTNSRSDVTIKRNIVFVTHGEVQLKLDIYQPKGEGPFPGVLVVHGGGWRLGTKRQLGGYAKELAARGHCAFAISYRLAPKYPFPAQIEDCRAAVKWVRENAEKYKVDPSRLGAIGYSAGGHLVSLLATTGEGPTEANGGVDTRLQAVVAGGAPTDFRIMPNGGKSLAYWLGGTYAEKKENFENASPAKFASKDDPPLMLFNGTEDKLVPIAWSMPLYENLKKVGVTVQMYKIEGAGHMQAVFDKGAKKAAFEFLDRQLALNK